VADSAWNLIWPGHGSLFLVGRDDYRTLLADRVFNALAGNGFRPSPLQQAITISPRLVGSGGRLAAAQGTYREYWSPGSGGELELGLEEN
jgi:hypothetical protein